MGFRAKEVVPLVVVVVVVAVVVTRQVLAQGDDTTTNDLLGKSAPEIVRKRGYLAEDHFVTTPDGYIINVVRCNNPLINGGRPGGLANKSVLLCIHGVTTNPQGLIMNSVNARPKNYGHLSAAEMSDLELVELLGEDPASNSLIFTALNFGHEVWLMSKRGTRPSQGHVNKTAWLNPISSSNLPPWWPSNWWWWGRGKPPAQTRQVNQDTNSPFLGPIEALLSIRFNLTYLGNTFNPRYWDFSMDEQAKYDVPAVVDYILNKTGRKQIATMGHSAGSALIIMSLIETPELAHKIEQSILWAPSFDLGNTLRDGNPVVATVIESLLPFTSAYAGPIPTDFQAPILEALLASLCENEITQRFLCEPLTSLLAGPGGGQQKIKPGFLSGFLEPTASHDFAHLIQSINKGKMHYYDYGTSWANQRKYGQDKPPAYNASRIISRTMSIWQGGQDALVTPLDAKIFIDDLKVPIEKHLIGGLTDNVFFNHISFLLHRNMSQLLILPSLKRLETPFV